MKYEIERCEEEKSFKPFKMTFVFETEDEYINFHDNVMTHILPPACDSHVAIGDLFMASRGMIDKASGTI